MFFSSSQVGIAIQDRILLVVETKGIRDGLRTLSSINAVEIPANVFEQGRIMDQDTFRTLLKEAFDTADPSPIRSKDIVFEIPEDISFQQRLDIPANGSDEELENAVLSEAEKLLPFPLDQVSWDYQVTGEQEGSKKVLFIAVPLEVVQEYYNFFLSCHLLPIGFGSRIHHLMLSVSSRPDISTVLLDIQNKRSSVLLFQGQNLLHLDQINVGENHLKKSLLEHQGFSEKNFDRAVKKLSFVDIHLATTSVMETLFQGLTELIARYPAESLKKPARFLFIGNTLYYYAFREFLKQHPVAHLLPLQGNLRSFLSVRSEHPRLFSIFSLHHHELKTHELSKAPSRILFEKTALQKILPSAVGAALSDYLSPQKKVLNLLPPLVRSIALWKETSPWFYVMTTILLLFSIGWLMIFGFFWGSTTAELRVSKGNFIIIERQFSVKKPESLEKRIEAANEEIKVVADIKSSQAPYAELVQSIQDVLPKGVFITALEFGLLQDKTLFELKGVAAVREEVIESYQALKSIPLLDKVLFPASNLDQSQEVPFSIPFALKKTNPS